MLRLLPVCIIATLIATGPAQAKCFNKASEGSTTVKGAKFQAFKAGLYSFSWVTWASDMASSTTPGYRIKTRYASCNCGIGKVCCANARICPTS